MRHDFLCVTSVAQSFHREKHFLTRLKFSPAGSETGHHMPKLLIKVLGLTLFLTLTGTHASAVLLSLQPGTPEACVPCQTTNNLNTEWVGNTELNGKILDFISVRLA